MVTFFILITISKSVPSFLGKHKSELIKIRIPVALLNRNNYIIWTQNLHQIILMIEFERIQVHFVHI